MRYSYTIIQAPADYGKRDELQGFLNDLNKTGGEIVSVVPLGNRYLLILYKN